MVVTVFRQIQLQGMIFMTKKITDSVVYIGCDDADLDLFESQFDVPNGMAYNSYAILDEKVCIMVAMVITLFVSVLLTGNIAKDVKGCPDGRGWFRWMS